MSQPARNVGVIGAGAMGFALIERLIKRDFSVWVFDPSPDARKRSSDAGALCEDSAEAVFEKGIPVITCVASPNAFKKTVEAALAKPVHNGAAPIIEASTIDTALKMEARAQLAQVGRTLLDCPVSGTSLQARNGDIIVFASGDEDALSVCDPIISAIARKTVRAGKFGSGMRLKLLANHLVALNSMAAAEVLVLARKAGLAPEMALEVLTQSAGNSRMLEVRGKMMIAHDYLPATGSIDLIVKDGDMIQNLAREVGCTLPLFSRAHSLYHSAQDEGLGAHDIGGIHGYLLGLNSEP